MGANKIPKKRDMWHYLQKMMFIAHASEIQDIHLLFQKDISLTLVLQK